MVTIKQRIENVHLTNDLSELNLVVLNLGHLEKLLDKAEQLCSICSDWNLSEVEINDEMVNVYDLKAEFSYGKEMLK